VSVLLGALMAAAGAGMLWLSWLLSQRRVSPGSRWGIRTGRSRGSDEDWFAAQQDAAAGVGLAGGIVVLGGLAVAVAGLANPFGIAAFGLSAGCAVVALVWSGLRAARPAEGGPPA
jgi:hypothetical protein